MDILDEMKKIAESEEVIGDKATSDHSDPPSVKVVFLDENSLQ